MKVNNRSRLPWLALPHFSILVTTKLLLESLTTQLPWQTARFGIRNVVDLEVTQPWQDTCHTLIDKGEVIPPQINSTNTCNGLTGMKSALDPSASKGTTLLKCMRSPWNIISGFSVWGNKFNIGTLWGDKENGTGGYINKKDQMDGTNKLSDHLAETSHPSLCADLLGGEMVHEHMVHMVLHIPNQTSPILFDEKQKPPSSFDNDTKETPSSNQPSGHMTSVINDAPSSNFSHQSVNQSGSKFVLIKQEDDKQNVSKLVVGNDIGEKDFKSRIKSLFTFMDNKHDELVNYDHLLSYLHRNVDNDIKGLVNGEKTMEHLPTEEKDGPFLWLLSVKEKGFPFFPGLKTCKPMFNDGDERIYKVEVPLKAYTHGDKDSPTTTRNVSDHEHKSMDECKTFVVKGHNNSVDPPIIPKHDWKEKQQMVTKGHRTTIPFKYIFARMIKGYSSTSDIASSMITSPFIPKEQNWKHILSKHWGYAQYGAQYGHN
jgi:hypothetical protein